MKMSFVLRNHVIYKLVLENIRFVNIKLIKERKTIYQNILKNTHCQNESVLFLYKTEPLLFIRSERLVVTFSSLNVFA